MASKKNKKQWEDEPLSDKWYTLKEACKMLDISVSVSKKYRKLGLLIVSKRFGKLYVNHYHFQKFLRDGLPAVISFLMFIARFDEVWEVVLA
ncbi:MAG: helix-turn-helix domain-containing protein [Ginsengibacter sp.]